MTPTRGGHGLARLSAGPQRANGVDALGNDVILATSAARGEAESALRIRLYHTTAL